MPSLTEIDRDLDKIAVDPARLAAVQHAARARRALSEIDRELAELGSGTAPRSVPASVDTEPPVAQAPAADDAPPSGQIDVPDDVLASSELPAVLALPPSDPAPPLSLDLDSGETPLEEPAELAPLSTTASTPFAAVVPPDLGPATETRALLDTGADDPSADLASLLGESDPMRDEGAVPLAPVSGEGALRQRELKLFKAQRSPVFPTNSPPTLTNGYGTLEGTATYELVARKALSPKAKALKLQVAAILWFRGVQGDQVDFERGGSATSEAGQLEVTLPLRIAPIPREVAELLPTVTDDE